MKRRVKCHKRRMSSFISVHATSAKGAFDIIPELVTILTSGEEVEKLPCRENNENQTKGARGSSIQFYHAWNLLTAYVRDKTGVTGDTSEGLKNISRCFLFVFNGKLMKIFK